MTTILTLAVTPMDGDDHPENWPWSELVGAQATVLVTGSPDHHAAAAAVCAAKSDGWAALRRLNAGEISRSEAREHMLTADVMAEEFRITYHPRAEKCFGIGDRHLGQPFQLYAIHDGEAQVVWSEAS